MNVIIPEKRRDKGTSFLKLVSYISDRDDRPKADELVSDTPRVSASQAKQAVFDRLVDYIDRTGTEAAAVRVTEEFADGRQRVAVGGVSCETNCFSWETAAAEMNMVAAQNVRCLDPVYHFILSWREVESPTDAQIFECAQHCLKALDMEGHQYVTAIHQDTDNTHCHVAVNRVNPVNYKAANLWNDADTLQKCCRVLEQRYGFEQDNGSWVWGVNNQLVRAPFRYHSAPQGTVPRQVHSNQESLYHYAVRTVRDQINSTIAKGEANWEYLHLLLHAKGLGLREQGEGLVVYDFMRPDSVGVKASSVHPALTKQRLEPHYGAYQGPPQFESDDPEEPFYGIYDTYQPHYELRDKGARTERREARAAARDELKARYQAYRDGWEKPDLNVPARQQHIALHYQAMKAHVRRSFNDPLLRKLMYRVAEFERMKAMAELRIALRQERQTLADQGLLRPLPYRVWVEQQALKRDQAAVSQLRGFVYREKRKQSLEVKHTDGVIRCGVADDSAIYRPRTHTSQLRRDGSIEYLRYGVVGVVDRGDQVVLKSGFDRADDIANYDLAVAVSSTKSGEQVKAVGNDLFVDRVMYFGCRFNYRYQGHHYFPVTDEAQQERYRHMEVNEVRPGLGYDQVQQSPRYDAYQEVDEPAPPTWYPRP